MSVEDNKATVRRMIEEVWNKGNLDVVDEVVTPEYVFRPPGQEFKGRDGLKQVVTMYRNAFPDLHLTIEDIIAEGDIVALTCAVQGTFKSEMMGIPPTGKELNAKSAIFVRFKDGKEIEAEEFEDQLTVFRQLGIPVPSQ